MALTAGTRLGPYEILAPLGSGGMGEVYRARDGRLGRDVAVKVLPQHLSESAEVRARFEREAKTISSLSHPHICTLFDVGREGDTNYLVMELIEGETLAARLAKGTLPVAEVLKLGAQIADALERAHRAGVVHRDLKPGNVMLTRGGAKLMDFGLARSSGLAGAAGGSGSGGSRAALTQSPTIAQPLTAEGTILGTFQYMAPEQLEGEEADARSDIWALGCVLYEMATGKRAFEGKSQASLISSIMREEPAALTALAPLSPPALEHIVNRCLAKDRDERWQSAGDVRRELEWITTGSSQRGTPAVVAKRRALPRGAWGWIAGAAIAAVALLVAFGPWSDRVGAVPLVRFMLDAPPGTTLPFPAEMEISPDGKSLAFEAADSGGTERIYFRALASPTPRLVPGTDNSSLPFWSPDSRSLAFFADGKLRKVLLDGSPPVVLCDAPDARGGAWSPGGVIIFAPKGQGPLLRVPANGGEPVALTKLDAARHQLGHRYPQFLPDGRHFLYAATGSGELQSTFVSSLDRDAPVEVCTAGSGARYAAPGYLLFLDTGVNSPQRRLLAQRFDPASLKKSGDAELLLDAVNSSNFAYSNVSANDAGTLVVQHWDYPHSSLSWHDRHGAKIGTAIEDLVSYAGGTLSPDGERLAFGGIEQRDLFVLDLKSGVSTRLTFANQLVNNVCWTFDGSRILFGRLFGAQGWEIFMKSADGTGPDSLLFHGPGLFSYAQGCSRDGKWLVALCSDSLGNIDVWRVPLTSEGKPERLEQAPSGQNSAVKGAALSPDGRWLAYVSVEGATASCYVQSFPSAGAKYQVAIRDPAGVTWSDKGDELITVDKNSVVTAIQVTTAGGFRQGVSTRLFEIPRNEFLADIARGEQRFLMGAVKDEASSARIEVVLGWPQLLARK
jgi:eukaryotic-like serine/threonine-protein kinase